MMKFVIEVQRATGALSYFVGPSIDTKYNKYLFTTIMEDAKLYDSMGHAVATAKKLAEKYIIISKYRVIEVEIIARPTGGFVVSKSIGVKTNDQSRYVVERPPVDDPNQV